jgi:hypothetical protein
MSSDEKKKIDAILVLEVLGRPPEYLIETLNNIMKNIGEESGNEKRISSRCRGGTFNTSVRRTVPQRGP